VVLLKDLPSKRAKGAKTARHVRLDAEDLNFKQAADFLASVWSISEALHQKLILILNELAGGSASNGGTA
jgi:hypothetical protein